MFAEFENGYVIYVSDNCGNTELTDEQTSTIEERLRDRPTAPTGFTYKLRADTLEWELVELPPIEEDDEATESDYITALQDLGVEV